jgi:hypothetical protein
MLTARQLGQEVTNAFHYRAEDSHRTMLERLVGLATGEPENLATLTREQLELRRNELHVRLAAVNDLLQVMGATRKGDLASGRIRTTRDLPESWGRMPLDPSDPSA